MYGCVYLITNLVNGKYYVGQTRNLARRIETHRRCKKGYTLATAIQKYGWPSFSIEVLGISESRDELDALERLWIIASNSIDKSVGYNLKYGGRAASFTPEVRARMSIKAKAREPKTRPGNPNAFKNGQSKSWLGVKRGPMSEEQKRALSEIRKGRPSSKRLSQEERQNLSRARQKAGFTSACREALMKRSVGNKYNVGRKRPDVAERNRRAAKCQF